MGYSRKQFLAKGFDEAEWQRCYHRQQQGYIRLKLLSVKLYQEGKSAAQIGQHLSLSQKSVRQYVRQYLDCGLEAMKILSKALPLPSMLILIPLSDKQPVKAMEVN